MSESRSAETPLSSVVREASHDLHMRAEGTPFIAAFVGGQLSRSAYVEFLAQLWFVYDALEAAAERMCMDPLARPFVIAELSRTPALEADLAWLLGPDWRSVLTPLASTARYRRRLTDVASTDPAAFVAHHYTRYIGDISGGQFLRLAAQRAYGFGEATGASFYHFPDSVQPGRLRARYRRQLDTSPWGASDRERLTAEVVTAFQLNVDLLEELGPG